MLLTVSAAPCGTGIDPFAGSRAGDDGAQPLPRVQAGDSDVLLSFRVYVWKLRHGEAAECFMGLQGKLELGLSLSARRSVRPAALAVF